MRNFHIGNRAVAVFVIDGIARVDQLGFVCVGCIHAVDFGRIGFPARLIDGVCHIAGFCHFVPCFMVGVCLSVCANDNLASLRRRDAAGVVFGGNGNDCAFAAFFFGNSNIRRRLIAADKVHGVIGADEIDVFDSAARLFRAPDVPAAV